MLMMLRLSASLLIALLFAFTAHAKPNGTWELVDEEDGIRTWKRELPGSDLPGFRGQVVMQSSPEKVLTVLLDRTSHTQWMHRCVESRTLQDIDATHSLIYNRTGAPWPVWDRDVILRSEVTKSADGKTIDVAFHNVASDLVPVPAKVVRMPKLVGFYKLRVVSEGKTEVTYQVESDVGGSLPAWLARRASKELPYVTLSKLRARVEGK
jgi:hypothetical protein